MSELKEVYIGSERGYFIARQDILLVGYIWANNPKEAIKKAKTHAGITTIEHPVTKKQYIVRKE